MVPAQRVFRLLGILTPQAEGLAGFRLRFRRLE